MVPSTKTLKFMSITVSIETINVQTKTDFTILISLNLIIGLYKVASTKTFNFMSATVYEIKRDNEQSNKKKYPYSEDVNT